MGDTPYGRFVVEWDQHGSLVHHELEIREPRSQGVGDTITKMTSAVGIQPCGGCNKRKKWLNKIFPYKQKDQ